MRRRPCEPTPINAVLTLSLGGTYPAPPNTRRGTIERPIAPAVVCPKNLRRETEPSKKLRDRSRFFTVAPNHSSQIPRGFCCCSHSETIYHRTRGLHVRKLVVPPLAADRERMTAHPEASQTPVSGSATSETC